MTDSVTALEGLAAGQFGVFTREQARSIGVTNGALARWVRKGRWQRILPATYRVVAVPASYRQRVTAAVLWSAPAGLASHFTAARLWRLEPVHSIEVHVCLPRHRRLDHEDVVVHSTRDLIPADRSIVYGIRTTSPLRTAFDLSGLVPALDLELMIEDGLRRRLFSPGQLRWRAGTRLGSGVTGSSAIRPLLAHGQAGATDSGWELRVARILTDAGFPEPIRQLAIGTVDAPRTVDLAYPGPPVVAFEYDSDAWHSGVQRRQRDSARRNALRIAGCIVVEVTPTLVADPERLVRTARALLATPMTALAP